MSKIIPQNLGCLRDFKDSRDRQYVDVMGAAPPDMPDFATGYDVEERFGALEDHSQDGALNCVGEGSSQDINMSIRIVVNRNVITSPRDIYSQIFLPSGGSSPREAYRLLKNKGVCEDRFLPTRPNGQYLTEQFARKRDDLLPNPVYWKIDSYYSISSKNIVALSQAIFANNGCGGAYFPLSGQMGHFIFFRGYGIYNGKQALKYRDSYEPYTKWITKNSYGNYYLQDGTPIDLAGIWTAFPRENWPKYKKKEVREEMLRAVWRAYPDLQAAFPSPKFYSPQNPNYSRADWARDHYDEFIERFEKIIPCPQRGIISSIKMVWTNFTKKLLG